MKIYFEDGALNARFDCPFNYAVRIDAADGYSHCLKTLEHLKDQNFKGNVYTNFLPAMRTVYSWNHTLDEAEVFIRNQYNKFKNINRLTDRELRFAHNIPHMWEHKQFEG